MITSLKHSSTTMVRVVHLSDSKARLRGRQADVAPRPRGQALLSGRWSCRANLFQLPLVIIYRLLCTIFMQPGPPPPFPINQLGTFQHLNPLTASAAYIRVFIFIKYHILSMLKMKCDINQQYLKTVDLHFVNS